MPPKRNTKRERKDEAKRRRLEEIRRRERRARVRRMYTIGAIVLVIGGLVGAVLAARAGSSKEDKRLAALATAGGCSKIENPKPIAGSHISPPNKGSYDTNPPSSGAHYNSPGLGPLQTGIYDTEVPNEGYVHNLEHGHAVIFYQPGLDPTFLDALKNLVETDPEWMLLAPRPGLPNKITFVAWGHIQRCDSPNAKMVDVAKAFYLKYKNKGPEPNLKGVPLPSPTSS